MPSPLQIPPLPSGWPFSLRGGGAEFALRPLSDLPGFPGAWNLLVPSDLNLDAGSIEMPGVFGRGGLRRAGDIIVRPYRRGGLVRHFDERLYLNPERFIRELTVHRALWVSGFPTVEPLGCGYRRRLWGVEGVCLTRFVEALPWPCCWERSSEVIPHLKILLESLCAWGLHAPDLNATNVLVTEENHVLLLDWDRADWTSGRDLMSRYRARLSRSLKKLGAPAEVLELI